MTCSTCYIIKNTLAIMQKYRIVNKKNFEDKSTALTKHPEKHIVLIPRDKQSMNTASEGLQSTYPVATKNTPAPI